MWIEITRPGMSGLVCATQPSPALTAHPQDRDPQVNLEESIYVKEYS